MKNILLVMMGIAVGLGFFYVFQMEKMRLGFASQLVPEQAGESFGSQDVQTAKTEVLRAEFAKEEFSDEKFDEINFGYMCQNARWVDIASNNENKEPDVIMGKFSAEDESGKNIYVLDNGRSALNRESDALDYFEEKEVEVEGLTAATGELMIYRIRCIGEETDEDQNRLRGKIMEFVAKNINEIHPPKSKDGGEGKDKEENWEVTDFEFVDAENLYVMFGTGEFGEDNVQRVLLSLEEKDGNFKWDKKAIFSENNDEWKLTDGKDKFSDDDPDNHIYYEYDYDLRAWALAN